MTCFLAKKKSDIFTNPKIIQNIIILKNYRKSEQTNAKITFYIIITQNYILYNHNPKKRKNMGVEYLVLVSVLFLTLNSMESNVDSVDENDMVIFYKTCLKIFLAYLTNIF